VNRLVVGNAPGRIAYERNRGGITARTSIERLAKCTRRCQSLAFVLPDVDVSGGGGDRARGDVDGGGDVDVGVGRETPSKTERRVKVRESADSNER
jgi:hypothetical protein